MSLLASGSDGDVYKPPLAFIENIEWIKKMLNNIYTDPIGKEYIENLLNNTLHLSLENYIGKVFKNIDAYATNTKKMIECSIIEKAIDSDFNLYNINRLLHNEHINTQKLYKITNTNFYDDKLRYQFIYNYCGEYLSVLKKNLKKRDKFAIDKLIINLFIGFIKDIQKLNDNSLIHLDIRFPNILYNEKTNKINIIDFDLSSHKDNIYDNIANLFQGLALYPFEYSIIYYIVEVYKNKKDKINIKNIALMQLTHLEHGILSSGYTKNRLFDKEYGLDTLFSGDNNESLNILFNAYKTSTEFKDIKNIDIFYKRYIKKEIYTEYKKIKEHVLVEPYIKNAEILYIPNKKRGESSVNPTNDVIVDTYNIIQNAEKLYINIIFDYYLKKIEEIEETSIQYNEICDKLFSIDYYKKIDIFYIGVLMIQMNGIIDTTLFHNDIIQKCICIEDPTKRICHKDLINEIGKYIHNPIMQFIEGKKRGGLNTHIPSTNLHDLSKKNDRRFVIYSSMPLKSKGPIVVSESKSKSASSFEIPIEKNRINAKTSRELSLKLLTSINNEIFNKKK